MIGHRFEVHVKSYIWDKATSSWRSEVSLSFLADATKSLRKTKLALLFLSILILPATVVPFAKAQSLSVTLNPSEGSPGTIVLMVISNFQTPSVLTITFGTTNVGTINAHTYSTASMEFQVPYVSPGLYTFTVTCSTGGIATKTFTVIPASSPAPAEIPLETPTETPMDIFPNNHPAITTTEFWSPLTIAIISAGIASASVLTVVYKKRGKQDDPSSPNTSYSQKTSSKETSSYNYRPSVPPTRYNVHAKANQMPTNRQQIPFTKICKHCKQAVRDDLNVCPYCFKRLR